MVRRVVLTLLALAALPLAPAHAGPSNDRIEDAITIPRIPFSITMDTTAATSELLEPRAWCSDLRATVWFRLQFQIQTPLVLHTRGSNFDTSLAVYRLTDDQVLHDVACNDDEWVPGVGSLETSAVRFGAGAGDVLYVQVGRETVWHLAPLGSGNGYQEVVRSENGADGSSDYDVALATFVAEAGITYRLRLAGVRYVADPIATLELFESPHDDINLESLAITVASLPTDHTEVAAEISVDGVMGDVAFDLIACPKGAWSSVMCFRFAFMKNHLWHQDQTWVPVVRWRTEGCVGDYEVHARAWWDYSVDPDLTNNQRSAVISIGSSAGGMGVGRCPASYPG